jgi:two-component system, NtrC family, sensor kinase
LQNFAAQAVIAIENARLITETREALEQQTATANILRVISSSPTDVQPTFEAIAVSASTLCGAANACVFQFDGSLIHFVAHYGLTAEQVEATRRVFPIPPGRGSITARAILSREIAHVADFLADPEFAHPSLSQGGLNTTLSVPMLHDGQPIGAITLVRPEKELFSDKQIDLLKMFADQAVIAIENVRLFNELNERTHDLQESLEYQTATSDVLKVISRSTSDVQPVMDTLVETAVRLCGADSGSIFIREGEVYLQVSAPLSNAEFRAVLRQ